jgi:hypothetical protein
VRRWGPFALAAAALLALSACEGGDEADAGEGGGGISEADVRDAGLKFARCMRDHGVDVPDPKPGLGGMRALVANSDLERDPDFREAERECGEHLQGLRSQLSDEQQQDLTDARLEFARCMRAEGFDVPDPQPGGGGGQGGGDGGPLGGLDLEDPRVQAAMDECREKADFGLPQDDE